MYKVIVIGLTSSILKYGSSLYVEILTSLYSGLSGGVLKKYPVLTLHCLP